VEDAHRQRSVLAVLDKLTQVREASLLGLGILLDDGDDGVYDYGDDDD